MSVKRKATDDEPLLRKVQKKEENLKKHSLDSDEEDDDVDEQYNVLDENDIEGEEDDNNTNAEEDDDPQRMTAFNMQEEMEMGHFDKAGHFIWKNEKEVRDNWLDNIDWQKVDKSKANPHQLQDKGLGEASDEDDEPMEKFNEIEKYRLIITYLKPKESINKALQRLGGDLSKLSSVERLKRKKAGTLTSSKEVIELTELSNEILTETGNMDIYQETYEQITKKLANHDSKVKSKSSVASAELDMYADDFGKQENKKLGDNTENTMETEDNSAGGSTKEEIDTNRDTNVVKWEFKWEQNKDKIEGPFTTEEMNKWNGSGHFKTGVWVRKCGSSDASFYSSNRMDFELYM